MPKDRIPEDHKIKRFSSRRLNFRIPNFKRPKRPNYKHFVDQTEFQKGARPNPTYKSECQKTEFQKVAKPKGTLPDGRILKDRKGELSKFFIFDTNNLFRPTNQKPKSHSQGRIPKERIEEKKPKSRIIEGRIIEVRIIEGRIQVELQKAEILKCRILKDRKGRITKILYILIARRTNQKAEFQNAELQNVEFQKAEFQNTEKVELHKFCIF